MSNNHNVSINDFDKICRTCAAERNLRPLYENATLLIILRSCTQIRYDECDALPKQICNQCIQQLIQMYNFANKCKMIDNALRKCLNDYMKHEKDEGSLTKSDIETKLTNETSEILPKTNEFEQIQLNEVPIKQQQVEEYQCYECVSIFDSYKNLKIHMNKQHNVTLTKKQVKPECKYKCLSCPKSYTLMKDLKLHMFTHSTEKPFKCQQCGRGFLKNSLLRHHYRIHTGEKPYACTVCEKTFRHPHSLTVHARVHTGHRPYRCDHETCDKAFSQVSCLAIHKRIHTGERPYRCDVCAKTWISRHKLLVHARTHTGEKKHRCTVCTKGFTQAVNLRNHMKIHATQSTILM